MPDKQSTPVHAAIDIGSNTIRVVVAKTDAKALEVLASDEALVRIGESVNASGAISQEKQDEAISVLRRYTDLAKKHNARVIFAVATEAIRKASNQDQFLAAIQRATDLPVAVIPGEIEAVLTFYGATSIAAQLAELPDSIGVLDLGGGSMELVLAREGDISWHTSLPIGSGLLHDRYLVGDPPNLTEIAQARAFLQLQLVDMQSNPFPPLLLGTGGSANTLLKLARGALGLEEGQRRLTRDDLVRCEGLLSALPADEIARRYGIEEKRARLLLAGTLIIRAVVEYFQLDSILISEGGIREGVALSYSQYGENWLEVVGEVSRRVDEQETTHDPGAQPFAQAGLDMLLDRALAIFEWRDAVIANEDIEAVHKMRVAARRLRALMDAYVTISRPKPFKKAYRNVKELADVLGAARDTDVMIVNLQQRMENISDEQKIGLQWFMQRLQDYRRQHQHQMEVFLETFDQDALLRQIVACLPEGASQYGKS